MARYLVIAASSAIGQSVTTLLKNRGDTVFTTARDNHKISLIFNWMPLILMRF